MNKTLATALVTALLTGCGSVPSMTMGVRGSDAVPGQSKLIVEQTSDSVKAKLRAYALASLRHFFEYMDQNLDGRVIPQEAKRVGMRADLFALVDQNADGAINLAEFTLYGNPAGLAEVTLKMAADFISSFDRDGNGKVSLNEYSAEGSRWFRIKVEKTVKNPNPDIKNESFEKHAGKDRMLSRNEMALLLGDIQSHGYTYHFGSSGSSDNANNLPSNPIH